MRKILLILVVCLYLPACLSWSQRAAIAKKGYEKYKDYKQQKQEQQENEESEE